MGYNYHTGYVKISWAQTFEQWALQTWSGKFHDYGQWGTNTKWLKRDTNLAFCPQHFSVQDSLHFMFLWLNNFQVNEERTGLPDYKVTCLTSVCQKQQPCMCECPVGIYLQRNMKNTRENKTPTWISDHCTSPMRNLKRMVIRLRKTLSKIKHILSSDTPSECYSFRMSIECLSSKSTQAGSQADRQAGRETDGQTGRQRDRRTDRQAGRETDRPFLCASASSWHHSHGSRTWWVSAGHRQWHSPSPSARPCDSGPGAPGTTARQNHPTSHH